MRFVFVLLAIAGCNQVLGLDRTSITHDAPSPDALIDALPQLCDPLPFDANRYVFLAGGNGYAWADARAACLRNGFDLAVIDMNDSTEIANEVQGPNSSPFWFGVSYDGTQWAGVDGCPPVLAWAAGDPTTQRIGDCVEHELGGMRSFDCTVMNAGTGIGAFCETPRPSPQCRAFAAQRNYIALDPTLQVTHDDAEQMCAAQNAHLVEIDSTEELDYVRQNYPSTPKFWLVATTDGVKWTSSTGCPQLFTWAQSEPIATYPCSYVDSGGMRAAPCNNSTVELAGVICEINQ